MVLIYSCLHRLHVLLMSKALNRGNVTHSFVVGLIIAQMLMILNISSDAVSCVFFNSLTKEPLIYLNLHYFQSTIQANRLMIIS